MSTLRILFIVITAGCVGLCTVGCKDDHAGHDHGPDSADHDHEGHDHGEGDEHKHDDHDHGDKPGDDHEGHDHGDHGHDEHASGEVTLTADALKRWGVRVEPLERHALERSMRVPARVAFDAEAIAHVGSLVSGRIDDVRVRIGDAVEVGDELMVIQSPSLGTAQSEFLQRRSAIAPAEAAVVLATGQYDRAKSLHERSQAIALSEVQRREAELRAAEGTLVAARSAATAAEQALHALGLTPQAVEALATSQRIAPTWVVRAPIAGRVIERAATLGESVGPERDALLVIADLSTVWVIADVPEARLGSITIGQKAKVIAAATGDRVFEGEVAYVSPMVHASTRTASVRIVVGNEDGVLRPGTFAEATIWVGSAGESPAVPESAVQTIEGATCVFVPVEGEANTFAKRVVRLGPAVSGMRPVLDGLVAGERYVAAGSYILKADLLKASAEHQH